MPSEPRKIPHLRWYIAVLLCLASELNYLDWQALSVLATQIEKDVGFTDAQYGQITSAFLMSYSVMYLVSGRILRRDRYPARVPLLRRRVVAGGDGHAFARTPFHFQSLRFALGAS